MNEELYNLIRENNEMLKFIINYLTSANDDQKDFMMNVMANLLSNNLGNAKR